MALSRLGTFLLEPLRDPVLLLALALAGWGLVDAWGLGRRSPGIDFYQFWVVAQVVGRDDVPSVYDEAGHARIGAEYLRRAFTDEDSERRRVAAQARRVLTPFGTPLLYAAFRPLSRGAYEDDHRRFRLLSLGAAIAGVLLVAFGVGFGPASSLLALAFVTQAFQPLKSDVRVGNVNQLQLAALAVYLWLSSRPGRSRLQIAAGALLASLVLFKPNLVPVVPLLAAGWLFDRRWRKLALQALGGGAGVGLAALATWAAFGSLVPWKEWLDFLRRLPPEEIPLRYGNMGPARLLREVLELDLAPYLGVVTLSFALACAWLGRRPSASADAEIAPHDRLADTAAVSAGVLVCLLSAPMVWQHYLLLALPAPLLLLRPTEETGRGALLRRAAAAAALVAIAIDPLAELFEIRDLAHQAVMTSAGLVALFVLVLIEMARGWARPGGRLSLSV